NQLAETPCVISTPPLAQDAAGGARTRERCVRIQVDHRSNTVGTDIAGLEHKVPYYFPLDHEIEGIDVATAKRVCKSRGAGVGGKRNPAAAQIRRGGKREAAGEGVRPPAEPSGVQASQAGGWNVVRTISRDLSIGIEHHGRIRIAKDVPLI